VVVVPPDGVKTDETRTGEATETVLTPPFEVTIVAELTEYCDSGVETNDEAETGTVTVSPLTVTVSVTYGDENPGVATVKVDPDGVVTVWVTGDGRWRVAVDPCEVSTWTEVSDDGMVSVVVPDGVTTCETTGDEANGMVTDS